MAQCKVHPESPLPGAPAAGTSDPGRPGTSPPRDLPCPPLAPPTRCWEPPARSAAAPCSEPAAPDGPPTPPLRAGTSSLHPCPEAARRPAPTPASARPSGCSPGWGREAARRLGNTRGRPCPGRFFNGEVGECGGGRKEDEKPQLSRQVKSVTFPEGKGAGWGGGGGRGSPLLPACLHHSLPLLPLPQSPLLLAPGALHPSLVSHLQVGGAYWSLERSKGPAPRHQRRSRAPLTSILQRYWPALPSPTVYSRPLPH